MNRRLPLLMLAALLCWSRGGIAAAQSSSEPLIGRYEVAAGVSWMAPASLGSLDATLTAPSGDRFRLFSTSTGLGGTPAFDVRFGRRLTRVIQAELAVAYASPPLRTTIDHDAENGSPTVAVESIQQISIGGVAVVYLPKWRRGSVLLPFLSGGGGYLRRLHEGRALAQTGATYQVGAGVVIPLISRVRTRGVQQFGIRADVRFLLDTGGVSVDGRRHTSPAAGASAFARF